MLIVYVSPLKKDLYRIVVTVTFLTASLLGLLFSDMVRVVDCHAGVLGSNPGGPKDFSLWNIALMVSEVFDELMQS